MSNLSQQQFDTFYHRTSPDVAETILKEGKLRPSQSEDQVFLSNQVHGTAKDFGKSVIEVQVPKKATRTDMSEDVAEGEKWLGFAPRDVKVIRGWSEIGKK